MPKGKKNKKRFSGGGEDFNDSRAAKKERQRAAFKKNRRFILPLILNTIVFFGIYNYLVNQPNLVEITMWVYFALTLGFGAAYIIYNRAFTRLKLTPDMLPNSMSREEKEAFIADGKERLEKSKWMITIFFPLLMTFILEVFNLFILDPMFDLSEATQTLSVISSVSFM